MAYILISCPYSERCYFNLRSLRSVKHWNMREGEYNWTFIARLHNPNRWKRSQTNCRKHCQSNYVRYKAWTVVPKYLAEINKNSPPRNFLDYFGGLSFYLRLYLLMSDSKNGCLSCPSSSSFSTLFSWLRCTEYFYCICVVISKISPFSPPQPNVNKRQLLFSLVPHDSDNHCAGVISFANRLKEASHTNSQSLIYELSRFEAEWCHNFQVSWILCESYYWCFL